MKTPITLLGVFLFVTGCNDSTTHPASLVAVDSRDYGYTDCAMKVVELERQANTSKLRLTYDKLGTSVGTSLFITRAFYEVAKARKARYFINLKEWDAQDGGRLFIVGFSDAHDADIDKIFGPEYSLTNEGGEPRTYMGVSQFRILFAK